MRYPRLGTRLLLLGAIQVACLGTTPSPQPPATPLDALFQEIGGAEVAVLLADPNAASEPGLPLEDILFLLKATPPRQILALLKQAGARVLVDVLRAIKRLECNRPSEAHPTGRFDIPNTDRLTDCALSDVPYLDKVVTLMTAVSGSERLPMLLRGPPLRDRSDPAMLTRYQEKLANLVVGLDSIHPLGQVIDDVADVQRLIRVVNDSPSAPLVVLIAEVQPLAIVPELFNALENIGPAVTLLQTLDDTGGDFQELAIQLTVAGTESVPQIAATLDVLRGAQDRLLADLLEPYEGDASGGLGGENLGVLFRTLRTPDAARNLGGFLGGWVEPLRYRDQMIEPREGLVRLLRTGVMYQNKTFPGLGPQHVAVMMESIGEVDRLRNLSQELSLEALTVVIGCTDRVGWEAGVPDFQTPCSALGLGW